MKILGSAIEFLTSEGVPADEARSNLRAISENVEPWFDRIRWSTKLPQPRCSDHPLSRSSCLVLYVGLVFVVVVLAPVALWILFGAPRALP